MCSSDLSQKSEVVYFDPNKDIALVRTRGLDARPVRLAQSALKVEQSGVVTGFPAGERFQALPVRVRTLVTARGDSIYGQPGAERQVYVLRGELDHGISGGPLSDDAGEVFGIIFAAGAEDEEIGYALSAAEIESAIEAAGDALTPVDNGSCRIR